MDDRTRTLLMAIDRHLAVGDKAASELWDVLTALRGPDSDGVDEKDRTTLHVRAKAFPVTAANTAARDNGWVWHSAGYHSRFPGMSIGRKGFKLPGISHFGIHIRAAAEVLGLA